MCVVPAFSTTVVVVYSDDGLIVAADSKLSNDTGGTGVTTKIFKMHNKFVAAALELTHFEDRTPPVFLVYDVPTWLREVEASLPKDVSFDDLMKIMAERVRSDLIPQMQPEYTNGLMKPNAGNMDQFEAITTFVVAGYRNGRVAVGVVQYSVDWQSKQIADPYLSLFADGPGRIGYRRFGVDEAISNVFTSGSYANKRIKAICPKPFQKWQDGRVLLDDSLALSRAMIKIEEEIAPDQVGGGVQVIAILINGDAYVVPKALPNSHTSKKKTAELNQH